MPGRVNAEMTQGTLNAIGSMTLTEQPSGCPWSAFFDPFVRRVQEAHVFMEKSGMGWAHPDPSNRLVDGVGFYHRTLETIHGKQFEEDRKRREMESKKKGGARRG